MKRSFLKRCLAGGAALGAALAAVAVAPAPAQATPYTSPDLSIMAAGSDTTQDVMQQIMDNLDGHVITTALGAGTMHTTNLHALQPGQPSVNVTGDVDCPDHAFIPNAAPTYSPPPVQWTAPAGSSHGRDYLGAEESYAAGEHGCVDIARSSSGPRSQATNALEKSTFEYYAYALDAQSWGSTSLKAPANLTRAQIQGIYNCTFTDWSQVGGVSGPIQRYLPTEASGTTGFFRSAFGVTAAMTSITTPSCPATKQSVNVPGTGLVPFEENQALTVESADIDKMITPYSGALWSYQFANRVNPTIDKRNGLRIGGFVTAPASGTPVNASILAWNPVGRKYKLDTAGVVNETSEANSGNPYNATTDFNGIRYVYNVLDNAGNLPGYQAAFKMVGFTNAGSGSKSSLCNNNDPLDADGQLDAAIILSYGFATLDTSNPNGRNAAGSTCRSIPLKP